MIKYLSKNVAESCLFGISLILQGLLEVKSMQKILNDSKIYPKIGILIDFNTENKVPLKKLYFHSLFINSTRPIGN